MKAKRPLRTLFFGMAGSFSRLHLAALLAAEAVDVVGIVVAQPSLSQTQPPIERLIQPEAAPNSLLLTLPSEPTIMELGWQHNIPVFGLRRAKAGAVLDSLRPLQADIACVACFSQRIPASLLALPKHGFLNVHPSLLPDFRGPEPLFWVFRHDRAGAGVTVHWMDEGLDSGDIAAQTAVSFPDGISGPAADRQCAEIGSRLLIDLLQQVQHGTAPRRPQGTNGRYFPSPTPNDFAIPLTWSAQHAYNFIRGTSDWNQPYTITGLPDAVVVKTAVSYHPAEQLPMPLLQQGNECAIQFSQGVLRVIVNHTL